MKRPLEDTLELMKDLRQRCEWDAAQTHDSLRPYLIEEAHEVDDAIRSGDDRQLREELGDLLLQVLFHAVVAEERGAFTFDDVAETFIVKMKGRHPHLYGDGVREPWERQKARKRERIGDGLPAGLPSLHRAFRLQDRAAGVGFDWPDVNGPLAKVEEEMGEVRAELARHARRVPATGHYMTMLIAAWRPNSAICCSRRSTCAGRRACIRRSRWTGRTTSSLGGSARSRRRRRRRGIDVKTAGLETLDRLWDEVKGEEER